MTVERRRTTVIVPMMMTTMMRMMPDDRGEKKKKNFRLITAFISSLQTGTLLTCKRLFVLVVVPIQRYTVYSFIMHS